MLSQLGIEGRLVQYLVALFIVLVLVGLFALVLRRITGGRMGLSTGGDRGRARQPRLGIVDVYDLDRQRQLVLLRRDNVEHLLLIGGPNDVVIETNIMRVAAGRPAPMAPEAMPTPVPERAPAPPLEAPQPFAPQPSATPAYAERPAPAPSPPPPAPAPIAAREATTDGPPRPILEPPVGARVNAPEPQPLMAAAQDPMGDLVDRVRTLRPEPPLVADVPMPEPVAPPAPRPAASGGATIATPRTPAEPTGGDAAVLSDMARQLEQALRRPIAPAAPAPAPPPIPAVPSPVRPPPQPAPSLSRPASGPASLRGPDGPRPIPTPPRAEPAPARAEPAPPPAAPVPVPPPPPAAPPPAAKLDPFSVDEIEAEFARLLGRSPDRT